MALTETHGRCKWGRKGDGNRMKPYEKHMKRISGSFCWQRLCVCDCVYTPCWDTRARKRNQFVLLRSQPDLSPTQSPSTFLPLSIFLPYASVNLGEGSEIAGASTVILVWCSGRSLMMHPSKNNNNKQLLRTFLDNFYVLSTHKWLRREDARLLQSFYFVSEKCPWVSPSP